jgi:hypothetical protein
MFDLMLRFIGGSFLIGAGFVAGLAYSNIITIEYATAICMLLGIVGGTLLLAEE